MSTGQLQLDLARHVGHQAADACLAKAVRGGFDTEACAQFMLSHLRRCGPTSGEDLTDASREAGHNPADGRAFGGVIQRLHKEGLIEVYGWCLRRRGHATAGGRVWRLARR